MNNNQILLVIFIFQFLFSCNSDVTENSTNAIPNSSTAQLSFFREQRIAIKQKNDSLTFYDNSNNLDFIPMGYNYTHVQSLTYKGVSFEGHSTFSSEYYNAKDTENMLSKLENSGYNTVRIFISPALISYGRGDLNQSYLANISNFIRAADNHHLSVIITTDMAPISYYEKEVLTESDITWLNTQYINREEINIEASFWRLLINEFRSHSVPLNAILSFEIRNEFFFTPQVEPFNKNEGVILHPNGKSYDLSSDFDRNSLIDASFLYWSSTIRNAIQEEDPEALVSVGFFAPEIIGTPSKVAISESALDFIDLHLYPSNAKLSEYVQYFDLKENKNKLIIMGEFGYVDSENNNITQMTNDLYEWKNNAINNYHLDGWLLWTWDTNVGMRLSVADKNNQIFNQFSPINN